MEKQTDWLLIDGSYYVFYRFYALISWYKLAKQEELPEPIENNDFVEKFKSTFIAKIKEIQKKLKLKDPYILVGRDCPREKIWRMKYLSSYKKNRVYDDSFKGGPFFKLTYSEELFKKSGAHKILMYPELEADDCLAIISNKILKTFPNANINIITSDMDYLQLACDNIKLYDLKYKNLCDRKSSFKDAEKDLFVKIITGDKSDNIKGVFKKCGPKTACKYFENRELFEKKLKEEEGAMERYLLNSKIIDFRQIPEDLIEGFLKKYSLN